MKSINVVIHWQGNERMVGQLDVYASRGTERFQFAYTADWARDGFAIDPALELIPRIPYIDNKLWGAFQDISPDRWGRLVQTRVQNRHLSESDFLLGVSDHMRMGALRLSDINLPDVFLADNHDVPKLMNLRELEAAVHRFEAGQESPADLAMIAQPGSSLGGAHPKASVEDENKLWLAKFQSNTDTERVSLWEATMLGLAKNAGIRTAHYRVLNGGGDRPVLLVERFDRADGKRIPFISAMTLLERNENSKEGASYIDIADALTHYSPQPAADKLELFSRMIFNAMTGNIDDHLRNHGFLREPRGWRLAPAYDINPTTEHYARRNHNLSFDSDRSRPSLDTCLELAEFFGAGKAEINTALAKIACALSDWRSVAKRNGLSGEEIKQMERSFEHDDTEKLLRYLPLQ
ncbi:type II toxin-antitoxin system HipA family toxin [Sodalis sp. dw_96]|uniref:type II toxin-antitoxin system HipA family toxin n=1 Tax=Sodalis sp. dw_96 TaxID=2719794 RepID=UPI001BD58371|nr:type II toxin-antitoxin system HipA family toxin [Sodalis sp. dw_96]